MSLAPNTTIFDGKYTIIEKLDEGRYGHIFKIQHNTSTKLYALKAVSNDDIRLNPSLKENIGREIRIHQTLNHPNIVKFIETTVTKDYTLIILEYIDVGDIWDILYYSDNTNQYFSEDEARDYFYQLIKALIYLRDRGIMHRDLKPENILINKEGIIKLGDYGWAVDHPSSSYVGTTKYCSPEMVASLNKYNHKTDVWSTGIILYEFLYGKVPFDSHREHKIEYKIQHNNIRFPESPHTSDQAKSLINFILNKDPKKRPDYEEILVHPWMTTAIVENYLNSESDDVDDIEFNEELNKEIEAELELMRQAEEEKPKEETNAD